MTADPMGSAHDQTTPPIAPDFHVVTSPTPRRDHLADETATTAASMLTPELLWWRDLVRCNVVDPGFADDDSNVVARESAKTRLAEIDREVARRERAARIDAGIPSPSDIRYTIWADIAAELRDVLPVPMALEHLSWPMRRTGRDRDGRDEYHGACPICGGKDRFIAWGSPRSRWLCRQCSHGRANDVISLWRNAHPGLGFRAACEQLAALAGVAA